MAANTAVTKTGAISGTDPSFILRQTINNDQGVILCLKYTKGTEANVTITVDANNPSLHPYGILTTAGLAIGSTTSKVANSAFTYYLGSASYAKAAVAGGTTPGNDVIVAAKYGAVAFDIDATGIIWAIEATDQVAEEFTTAALAVAALPAVVPGRARMGHVTATKSDGAFTFGTTALNAANTTVAYTSLVDVYRLTSLNGILLSAYTLVLTATGNYRIPLPVISSEKIVCANITFSSSAQDGAVIANLVEA